MKPYDTEQDKKEQVREMFDRIAPAYDRLNHTLSFQIDKLWRRHVVRIVRRMQPRRILDVATGTGDLALAMARRMRGVQVLGVDLSENMLAEARRKATACGLDERVVLSLGDAERLEVADASVDVVTVAFGVRNFGDLGAGLREIVRVLKPGGIFFICNEANGETAKDDKWTQIINGMTIYTDTALKAYLEQAGFCRIQSHKNKKGWLCVTARK